MQKSLPKSFVESKFLNFLLIMLFLLPIMLVLCCNMNNIVMKFNSSNVLLVSWIGKYWQLLVE